MAGGTKKQVELTFRIIQPDELDYVGKSPRQQRIGEGGCGYVRKAVWRGSRNKMYVAVKCFFKRPDDKFGFVEELRGLTMLKHHRHIVQLLGACNMEDPYIVLEYAPLSLEKVLHEKMENSNHRYDYTADHVMNWSYQLAVALDFVHGKKMLHRDIKPSNLLLFDDGRLLKLCDFGTSRKLDRSLQMYKSQDLTGMVGTARYMAPEVIVNKGGYDKACDVYSYGIAVWEMLARRKPVIAMEQWAIVYLTVQGVRPQKLEGLPAAISDMIDRCWAEPSERPDMGVVSQKLKFLCQYVNADMPIREMDVTLDRSGSVMYSKGDHLEPPHADVKYDSLEDNSAEFYT